MSIQTLQFYTLGPEFTRLIRSFITEGSFHTAYEIIKDGGAPESYIKGFFNFETEFVGDTRDDSFAIRNCDPIYKTKEELGKTYYYALKTLASCDIDYEDEEGDINFYPLKENKNFKALLKVFTKDEVGKMILSAHLGTEYNINPEPEGIKETLNAVILKDGTLIKCGYQQHHALYASLYMIDLVDNGDWTKSSETFHISSGELSGELGNYLEYPKLCKVEIPKEALATLFKYQGHIRMYGFGRESMANSILKYISFKTNKGGKFNNLTFLKEYYPEINLPHFSLIPISDSACIRTSPKYSMPGLLTSKFDVNENSIKEIEEDFEKYKSSFPKDNELHYFYQEFLEGKNGVAHYRGFREKLFTYSVSSTQGAIVEGKETTENLSYKEGKTLEGIVTKLGNDLSKNIQVEFVISEDKVYIVQLRILESEPEYLNYTIPPDTIIGQGKSFCKGHETVSLSDTLVLDSDADDSSLLIGKKALVIRKDVEFSHILALSKALRIPSIYAVGNLELPEEFTINTQAVEGYITK